MKKCVFSCAAGLRSRFSRLLAAFCVAAGMSPVLAFAADIRTVYLKESANYHDSNKNPLGFAGASWVDENGNDVEIDRQANFDFVVKDKKYLSPRANNEGETITANSITFGEKNGTIGYMKYRKNATFNCANGLFLANGYIYNDVSSANTIGGNVTVTASSSVPFLLRPNSGITADTGFKFTGKFKGASGTGLQIRNPYVPAYTVTLDDASEYYGDIDISATNAIGTVFRASIVATTLSARNVSFAENCTFELTSSARASVANLTMRNGSTLKFKLPVTPNTEPFLTVGTSFTCWGNDALVLDASAVSLPVSSPVSYPILRIPAAYADAVSFVFDESPIVDNTRPVISRNVDSETGKVTFIATFCPTVVSVSGGTGDESTLKADAPSSMTNALVWSDEEIVHNYAYYTFNLKNKYLRTPWFPEGVYAFSGCSLSIGDNTKLIIACRDFICSVLWAYHTDGASVYCAEASDVTFHGDIASQYNLTVSIYSNHCFTLDGEIKGPGDVIFAAGSSASSFHGSHRGDFVLTRASDKFKGKMTLSSKSEASDRKWSSAEPYAHVWYSDPACFGGPLDAFAYDALKIEKMARLITTNNVVFSDLTRGLFLSGIAQLETPEATDSLTLLQPVTVNGRVYKQGAGTLAMGGELKFIDAENARTDTPPDDAAKRTLYVQGGVLKPLAADALNGLDIVFSNSVNVAGVNMADVALELDIDTEDAELKTYGLRNTKSTSPLTLSLAGGATKVPVRLISARTSADEAFSVGVMTVKAEIADETFAKLDIRKPEGLASIHMSRKVETDAAAGTSTLVVTFKHTGFGVVVR